LFKDELIASIPIAHWYVEKWEELVIRQQDGNGYWENVNTDTSDVIKIDDVKQVIKKNLIILFGSGNTSVT
jgi:uncharacterized protein YqjF (DUF2071 family)